MLYSNPACRCAGLLLWRAYCREQGTCRCLTLPVVRVLRSPPCGKTSPAEGLQPRARNAPVLLVGGANFCKLHSPSHGSRRCTGSASLNAAQYSCLPLHSASPVEGLLPQARNVSMFNASNFFALHSPPRGSRGLPPPNPRRRNPCFPLRSASSAEGLLPRAPTAKLLGASKPAKISRQFFSNPLAVGIWKETNKLAFAGWIRLKQSQWREYRL